MPTRKYCLCFLKPSRGAFGAVSVGLALGVVLGGTAGMRAAEGPKANAMAADIALEPFKVAKPQPGRDAVYDATQAIERKPNAAAGYVARGQAYRIRDEYAKALVDLDRAVALDPKSSEALVERSATRLANADTRGALEDAQAAIRLSPAGAGGYVARGAARLERGETAPAIDDFTRAIAVGEKQSTAYLLRARAKMELAPPERRSALSDVESAQTIAPASADVFYGKGVVLLANGDQYGAAESFKEALRLNPSHLRALFEQTKLRYNRWEPAEAHEEVERLLLNAEGMVRAEILLLRADIRCARKQPQAALADCEEAQRLAPDFALVYLGRSAAKLALDPRDLAGARTEADEAVARLPKDARAYHARANVQLQANDNEGAIASWDQAIALNANLGDFYAGRAAAKAKLQRFDEAKADVSRALKLAPNLPMALSLRRLLASLTGSPLSDRPAEEPADQSLGDLFANPPTNSSLAFEVPDALPGLVRGRASIDREKALVGFNEQLATEPDNVSVLEQRAKIKTELTKPDWPGAVADATKVIELDPRRAPAFAIRGRSRMELKDMPGALADLNQALELDPDLSGEAYIDRGGVKTALQDDKGAVADFDRGIEMEISNPDMARRFVAAAFSNRGSGRGRLGDHAGALVDYDEALKLAPDFAEVYYNRAHERYLMKDHTGALVDYTLCIKLKPKFPNAYVNRGGLRYEAGDLDAALKDYDEAIRLVPTLVPAYQARVSVYFKRGEHEKVIADCTRCIEAKAGVPNFYYYRGASREATGDPEGAMADYDRALQLSPGNTSALWARAQIFRRKGDGKGELADLNRWLEAKPTPEVFATRGRLLARLGDFTASLADFERAKEDPREYTRFFHFIVARRLGKPEAEETLRQQVPTWSRGWPKTVGSFLIGQISEADFLALAEKGDPKIVTGQRCEAWFYAGMAHFFAGRKAKAKEYFNRSLESGEKTFTEYQLAEAELKRMGEP